MEFRLQSGLIPKSKHATKGQKTWTELTRQAESPMKPSLLQAQLITQSGLWQRKSHDRVTHLCAKFAVTSGGHNNELLAADLIGSKAQR